jgi:hypothetical protein
MKTYEEVEAQYCAFPTSALLDGSQRLASGPHHLTHGETDPGTHRVGGRAGPRGGVGAVKGKVVCAFYFNWARHEDVLGNMRYSSTHFLTSALDGGEWSASRTGRLTPRERAPGTHSIGGWVGPRAVLNAVVKRYIPRPRRESNPRTPIVQPVDQRYTD